MTAIRSSLLYLLDNALTALRTNINTEITAISSETPFDGSDGDPQSLPSFEAKNITLGDLPGAPPLAFPALRITEYEARMRPTVGAGESRGEVDFSVVVYNAINALSTSNQDPSHIESLHRASLAICAGVSSCLEKHLPTMGAYKGIYSVQTTSLSSSPGGAERLNRILSLRSEVRVRCLLRMRQSLGI